MNIDPPELLRAKLKQQVLDARLPFKRQRYAYTAYCEAAKPLLKLIHQGRYIYRQFSEEGASPCELVEDQQYNTFSVVIHEAKSTIHFVLDRSNDRVNISFQPRDGHSPLRQCEGDMAQLSFFFSQLVMVHCNLLLEETTTSG